MNMIVVKVTVLPITMKGKKMGSATDQSDQE